MKSSPTEPARIAADRGVTLVREATLGDPRQLGRVWEDTMSDRWAMRRAEIQSDADRNPSVDTVQLAILSIARLSISGRHGKRIRELLESLFSAGYSNGHEDQMRARLLDRKEYEAKLKGGL